jgi:hypothetical protein
MRYTRFLFTLIFLCPGLRAQAEKATPLSALAKMPVREVTVFKDGHALMLHSGKMPTTTEGDVQLDNLPTPVLGTFWPYSADKKVKLSGVTASQRRVSVDRTALNMREMLEANVGSDIAYTDAKGVVHTGKLIAIPTRSAEELETTGLPGADPRLPEKGGVILIKTTEGTAVVGMDAIQNVTFRGDYKPKVSNEEFRNLLTLKLDWPNNRPEKLADVGMIYLQKGLRWIPSYKISLDGKENATIHLQATLINEMTDLNSVTAHLVVGVPTFFFQDTPDPIALQQAFAQLSPYFQTGAQTAYAFSNSIATQARMGERLGGQMGQMNDAAPIRNLGPEIGPTEKSEDLFLFTVKNVTLKRGQRMVIPVAELTLKYRDVYTLEVPVAPPAEIRPTINEQQAEILRLQMAPKILHKIRMTNKSAFPLTTAPALIVSGERVIAQGMMTYTAVGGETDLNLTTAVDVRVKKEEKETQRTPNAAQWRNTSFSRVDLNGVLSITNYRSEPIELEVTRLVMGKVDRADNGGAISMINLVEERGLYAGYPGAWWAGYSWPWWWSHFNGIGRITWKRKLEAGKSLNLTYDWHYYWE